MDRPQENTSQPSEKHLEKARLLRSAFGEKVALKFVAFDDGLTKGKLPVWWEKRLDNGW